MGCHTWCVYSVLMVFVDGLFPAQVISKARTLGSLEIFHDSPFLCPCFQLRDVTALSLEAKASYAAHFPVRYLKICICMAEKRLT